MTETTRPFHSFSIFSHPVQTAQRHIALRRLSKELFLLCPAWCLVVMFGKSYLAFQKTGPIVMCFDFMSHRLMVFQYHHAYAMF